MSRRLKLGLVVLAVLGVVAGLARWALPEVVRRVTVTQVAVALGRRVSIEDIDLNLLTGRFAIKKLRVAEREGPDAFVALDRLEGRIRLLALPALDMRLS